MSPTTRPRIPAPDSVPAGEPHAGRGWRWGVAPGSKDARRRVCALAVATLLAVSSCASDDDGVPDPGGGGPGTTLVRAPNGTNMGADPLNAGTGP
jgi:hypothetical protein